MKLLRTQCTATQVNPIVWHGDQFKFRIAYAQFCQAQTLIHSDDKYSIHAVRWCIE